jgi:hypothetical protein
MHVFSRLRLFLLAGVLVADVSTPAEAVVVVGDFQLRLIDFIPSAPPTPPPLAIGTPGPMSGQFIYDTGAVATQLVSPDLSFGRYTFVNAASLSLTLQGLTYSTSARPDNPLEIVVSSSPSNNFFSVAPAGVIPSPGFEPSAPDPSNPLAAYPFIEFQNGAGALSSGALPTSSFPEPGGGFMDPAVFLASATQPRTPGGYLLFFLAGPVTITTVPEPGSLGLLVLGLTLLGFGLTKPLRR